MSPAINPTEYGWEKDDDGILELGTVLPGTKLAPDEGFTIC